MTEPQITETEDGCWTWHGDTVKGHPRIKVNGNSRLVGRLFYARGFGVDLTGIILRRLCENELCIHPQHRTLGGQLRRLCTVAGTTARAVREITLDIARERRDGWLRGMTWNVERLAELRCSKKVVTDLAVRHGVSPLVVLVAYSKLVRDSIRLQVWGRRARLSEAGRKTLDPTQPRWGPAAA